MPHAHGCMQVQIDASRVSYTLLWKQLPRSAGAEPSLPGGGQRGLTEGGRRGETFVAASHLSWARQAAASLRQMFTS